MAIAPVYGFQHRGVAYAPLRPSCRVDPRPNATPPSEAPHPSRANPPVRPSQSLATTSIRLVSTARASQRVRHIVRSGYCELRHTVALSHIADAPRLGLGHFERKGASVDKPLSWNEIRSRLDEFVHDYADAQRENAEAQSFWRDLLNCYGVSTRRRGLFEQRAQRASTGGAGRIDVFWPGVFIAEHKSAGALERATGQAEDYLLGGDIKPSEQPRYVINCDFVTMRIIDLEADGGPDTITFPVAELPQRAELLGFLAGYTARRFSTEEQEAASVAAAKLMARLYAALSDDADTEPDEEDPLNVSMLLTRLLFLMFGDDAGLWDRNLFLDFIENRTSEDGHDVGPQLLALFDVLNTPEGRRSTKADESLLAFPYVNGALFADRAAMPYFDRDMRDALLEACRFDWTMISPAVFGSLFQAIKSKQARREGGEHYTTEANILKTIEPLFLDELRARVKAAWNQPKRLRQIHAEMGDMRYLDPACGCGNFLVVAYREMRRLELDLLVRLKELDGSMDALTLDGTWDLKVSLDQFHGIEINWWPAKIAETAMFLVDHQANREMALALGQAPNRLPIKITAHIRHANALTTDWRTVVQPTSSTYVFGNPPFVGKRQRTEAQKRELHDVWNGVYSKQQDYVTAWYAKTVTYFGDVWGSWAFVSTNSITQGEPVAPLFAPILRTGWKIAFAHRTFAWSSEARGKASVHCVIVGFTRRDPTPARLFFYSDPRSHATEVSASQINAYLVDGPNVLVEKRTWPLSPALPRIALGSQPSDGGHLLVSEDERSAILSDPHTAKYLRRYMMGSDLINGTRRWCLWMEDLDPKDVVASPELAKRLEAVREYRLKSTYSSTVRAAQTPHLFWWRAQPKVQYLAIPRVFAERRTWATCALLGPETVVGDKVYTCVDPDGFAFAITASSMFITWQKTVGGRLKSDPSFSNTIAWNNIPLPQVDALTRAKIIRAGQGVLDARNLHPDRSLAEHYNPLAMDPTLVKAHNALDAVVDRAFGAKRTCTSERERQEILFARYQELIANLRAE